MDLFTIARLRSAADGLSAMRLYYFIEDDRVYFAHTEQNDDYGDEDG